MRTGTALPIILTAVLAGAVSAETADARDAMPAAPPVVAGWVETVTLTEQALVLDAKLDTGADTSSIGGRDVERIVQAGRVSVRFAVEDGRGGRSIIEAPLARETRIRRSGGRSERRPVVRLAVCVAGIATEAEFTVADRAGFEYPVLIGRNVMAGRLMIDPGRERVVSDRCPGRR